MDMGHNWKGLVGGIAPHCYKTNNYLNMVNESGDSKPQKVSMSALFSNVCPLIMYVTNRLCFKYSEDL